MFLPILGHLQVVSYSLESEVLWWQGVLYSDEISYIYITRLVIEVPLSLGYTKQPEDGLKWAATCSCGIYVHFVHKLCCVLTANYTLYLFIEHNGDVTLKNSSKFWSSGIYGLLVVADCTTVIYGINLANSVKKWH